MFEPTAGIVAPRLVSYSGDFRETLRSQISKLVAGEVTRVIYVIDCHFSSSEGFAGSLPFFREENVFYLRAGEPTTDGIDDLVSKLGERADPPDCIVGIGGGSALDTAKAVAMTATNGGFSAELQGWDKAIHPGIPKVGVPTLIGTGAEASRTAVLINSDNQLKLGINSDFTTFDGVVFDSELSRSVPIELAEITLTDAYFHSMEILTGRARNAFSDACAEISLSAFREHSTLGATTARPEKAIVASYFAGIALSGGIVGLVHPLSAALGAIFSLPHTTANLCALSGLRDFYPAQFEEMEAHLRSRGIPFPTINGEVQAIEFLSDIMRLTLVHEKPLRNFLGERFAEILNESEFSKMLKLV